MGLGSRGPFRSNDFWVNSTDMPSTWALREKPRGSRSPNTLLAKRSSIAPVGRVVMGVDGWCRWVVLRWVVLRWVVLMGGVDGWC